MKKRVDGGCWSQVAARLIGEGIGGGKGDSKKWLTNGDGCWTEGRSWLKRERERDRRQTGETTQRGGTADGGHDLVSIVAAYMAADDGQRDEATPLVMAVANLDQNSSETAALVEEEGGVCGVEEKGCGGVGIVRWREAALWLPFVDREMRMRFSVRLKRSDGAGRSPWPKSDFGRRPAPRRTAGGSTVTEMEMTGWRWQGNRRWMVDGTPREHEQKREREMRMGKKNGERRRRRIRREQNNDSGGTDATR